MRLIRERTSEFQQFDDETQKNILGHIMYQRVESSHNDPDALPKITAMLIDQDVLTLDEILEIIENDESLKERIEEAIDVLEENVEDN